MSTGFISFDDIHQYIWRYIYYDSSFLDGHHDLYDLDYVLNSFSSIYKVGWVLTPPPKLTTSIICCSYYLMMSNMLTSTI